MASKSKSNFLLLLSTLTLLVIIGGIFLGKYFSNPSSPSNLPIPSQTPPVSQTTLTPIPTPVLTLDSTTGWKIYTGTSYSISFPRDWQLKKFSGDIGFKDTIALISPSRSSSLQIGLKYDFPYDQNGSESNYKKEKVNIIIGKKTYSGVETNYKYNDPNDSNQYSVSFTEVETPDMVVTDPNIKSQEKTLPFFFLFGNDYPLSWVGPSERISKLERSLDQYLQDKKIILQILSTFKFLN